MRTEEKTIIKKYWEAGDLIKILGEVVTVVSMEGCEVEIKDIPTQDEINNYRLEKCKKDYPIGTKVISTHFKSDIHTVNGNFEIWELFYEYLLNTPPYL